MRARLEQMQPLTLLANYDTRLIFLLKKSEKSMLKNETEKLEKDKSIKLMLMCPELFMELLNCLHATTSE